MNYLTKINKGNLWIFMFILVIPLFFLVKSDASDKIYFFFLSILILLLSFLLARKIIYRTIFKNFTLKLDPDIILIMTGSKFKILGYTRNLLDFSGFASWQISGKNILYILDRDSQNSLLETLDEGESFSIKINLKDKNGFTLPTYTDVEIIKGFLFPCLLFFIRSTSKINQNSLEDSGSKLDLNQLMLDFAGEGIVGVNLEGKVTFLNIAAANILGFTKNEVINRDIKEILGYNILDYDILNRQILHDPKPDPNSNTSTALEKFFKEFDYRKKDGSIIPIEFTIRVLKHDDRILGSVIVIRDISEKKMIEDKLTLATRVFENISEGILVTNSAKIVQSINPAFTAITGYTPEEIIGGSPKILQSGIHDKEFYEKLWLSIRENGRWEGEIWNKRKNGEVYPERLCITTIRDRWGNVINYIGMFNDITNRKRDEVLMEYRATHDTLTDLYNRNYFYSHTQNMIKKSKITGIPFAILFIDLDEFKKVNDSMGHEWGDQMLKEVSSRILNQVRSGDALSRIGGDEFIILLSDASNAKMVYSFAKRMIQSISAPYSIGNRMLTIGASIGISIYPDDAEDVDELIKLADTAMYHIKKTGKNNFIFYSELVH